MLDRRVMNRNASLGLLAALAAPLALVGCGGDDGDGGRPMVPDDREPCAERNPRRDVFFGDLHVHTRLSFDAYLNEVRGTPADAYAFAQGAPLRLPPLDASGEGTVEVQIDRPLDFAAVTDHAEYLGEIDACTDPGSPIFDTTFCMDFRAVEGQLVPFGGRLNLPNPDRFPICDDVDCRELAVGPWRRTQEAAEAAYDRTSACSFTTFVGYEWSSALNLSNLHRNIIFRSAAVPDLPTSYFETGAPEGLWRRLEEDCRDGIRGCDVISIPHNTNWSNGRMFLPEYPEDADEAAFAARRASFEPILEVYQHKGDSECSPGLSGILGDVDELCAFEKLRLPPFDQCGEGQVGSGGTVNAGCVSQRDFLRGILVEGLREEARIGVNPFPLGVIASSDTHNATPGEVTEADYVGHFGSLGTVLETQFNTIVPGGPRASPGGLVAIWAEENSRGALFDAMKRRETYGTSGPRISVRFFGGWDLPEDLCDDGGFVPRADDAGVPMGADLPAAPRPDAVPRFAVLAAKDPGTDERPGTDLERIQIIKGSLAPDGTARVDVFDVAGAAATDDVDPATCVPPSGSASLCTVWSDPDHDPADRAFYYVRVTEQPTCRWSVYRCAQFPEDARPEVCDELPTSIRERAWTSPIFRSPDGDS